MHRQELGTENHGQGIEIDLLGIDTNLQVYF